MASKITKTHHVVAAPTRRIQQIVVIILVALTAGRRIVMRVLVQTTTATSADGNDLEQRYIAASTAEVQSEMQTLSPHDKTTASKKGEHEKTKEKEQKTNTKGQRRSTNKHWKMFLREKKYLNPTLAQQRKREIKYPFIPSHIITACGIDKFDLEEQMNNDNRNSSSSIYALPPLQHAIAYIKAHKTGSSTIRALVDRILYGRGSIKLVPEDYTYLGWIPKNDPFGNEFPGNVVEMENVLAQTKYDAFTNHAVFSNRSHISQYLKEPLVTTTILREPISRAISAYNFFPLADSWDAYLENYANLPYIGNWKHAMGANNLAYALGWYHAARNSNNTYLNTDRDHNETAIQQFLNKIDPELDLVMILERLPESLVLLKEEVPELTLTELVWLDYDGDKHLDLNKKKEYPATEAQSAKLRDMLFLDRKIYEHFSNKFDQRWEKAVAKNPKLVEMKDALQCAHDMMVTAFQDPDATVPFVTWHYFGMQGVHLNYLLKARQLKLYREKSHDG